MFKIANAFAQAMIAFVITFIIALVLGDSAQTRLTVVEILSEFPVFSVWFKMLESYTIGRSNPELVVTLTATAYVSVFVDALFVGVVVHIVNSVKKTIESVKGRRTVDILSTYLGVIVSFLIVKLIKLGGEYLSLLIELGVIVIMLWGIKMILLPGKMKGNLLDIGKLWTIFVDSVYGLMVAGYITKIVMLVSGMTASVLVGVIEVIIFSVVLIVAGYIAYLITGKQII